MLCPRCLSNSKEVELQKSVLHGIEIDVCNSCGGIWFDKLELSEAISLSKEEVTNFYNKLSNLSVDNKPVERDLVLNCPKCNVEMNKYRYMYTSSIYIDSCDRCEGIWLDKGELLSILNYLEEASKVDPEKEAAIISKVKLIKKEYELKEREFVDSLVKLDDTAKNPITKALGEILQAIHTFIYRKFN